MTSVTIPNSVTRIWDSFKGCNNLKNVYCYAEKVPQTSSDAFTYTYQSVLYVPSGSIDAYKKVTPWKNFQQIVAIGSMPKYKLTYKIDGVVYKTYEMELGSVIIPEEPPVKEELNISTEKK